MSEYSRIAVMAGTPVDTAMGKDFILSRVKDAEVVSLPVAENPDAQTVFQHAPEEEKKSRIRSLMTGAMEKGAGRLFVYCNSLSGAVDFPALQKETGMKTVTPLMIYEDLGKQYGLLAGIAANNQSLSGIEKALLKGNPETKLIGAALLPAVHAVEAGTDPEKIVRDFHLADLCRFFEGCGCEALILGCTHFPWFKEELQKVTRLTIIDPAEKMLDMLKS